MEPLIYRMGALQPDILEKWKKDYPPSARIAFWQLNTPHYEWSEIIAEHRALLQHAPCEWAHVVVPTAHGITTPSEWQPAPITVKTVTRLAKQINAEAWLIYCQWFCQDVDRALQSFQPSDAKAYALRGFLDDFHNQVYSPIAAVYREQIRQAYEEYNNPTATPMSLERAIVGAREGMLECLEAHNAALQQIILGIPKIQTDHPSLIPLLRPARLLAAAIDAHCFDWVSQMMIGALLDEALGVISYVNSDEWQGRTSWGYAVWKATAALHRKEGIDRLAFTWEETQDSPLGKQLKLEVHQAMQTIDPVQEEEVRQAQPSSSRFANPIFLSLLAA